MPYREELVEDFECNVLCCTCNQCGFCDSTADVDTLSPNEMKCSYFIFGNNREFITSSENEIEDIVEICSERDIEYKVIEAESNRLVLKTLNNKSGLFKISEDWEKDFYFFSSTEGGVGFVHKSVKEADLFSKKVWHNACKMCRSN